MRANTARVCIVLILAVGGIYLLVNGHPTAGGWMIAGAIIAAVA